MSDADTINLLPHVPAGNGTSDHGLLIAIHGGLNKLAGQTEGFFRQLRVLEDRQAQCELRHNKHIEALELRVNQWIGMGKGFIAVISTLSLVNILFQAWHLISR